MKIKTFNETLLLGKISDAIFKKHQIPVTVKKFYTDVLGTIIAKNTAPAAIQKPFPVYLFGQFDRNGGYNIGQQVVQPINAFFVGCFTSGLGVPFLFATGLNTIQAQILPGDIVLCYTDDLDAPSTYIWVVISAGKNSIASIISNSQTEQKDGRLFNLYVKNFNYSVDTFLQYNQDLNFTFIDNIGNFETNQVSPLMFRTPYTEQEQLIQVKTPFKVDQYIGIYFYMLYESDEMVLTFDIERR